MKPELIEIIKSTVQNGECFAFSNIDGCTVKCRDCRLKVRFDECANRYFGIAGGCDCIIIFKDKISLIECKRGKFGSHDAKRSTEQIKKCFEFVKNRGYSGYMEAVVYYEYPETNSIDRVKTELRRLVPVKFCRCGDELT